MPENDIILPDSLPPAKGPALIKPVSSLLVPQAKNVLKGAGLSLIKPQFLLINASQAELEDSVNQGGAGIYNYDKKNVFGLPLFDTVVLNGLSYEDFEGKNVTIADFTLDIALIEVNPDRNIVRTAVAGRNGTVKEYMSDGDYDIKINGSLINPSANIPPESLVRSLNAFCKSQVEIKVNSTFLSYLDIFSIVIYKPKFTQRQGARNTIDYELLCWSETPFELKQDA